MERLSVTFTAPRRTELRSEPLPSPGGGEVMVEALCSAISAGSELLLYRGEFPKNLRDSSDPISSDLHYPLRPGYACAGRVVELGHDVERELLGQTVFSFQGHTTHFIAAHDSLIRVPEGIMAEMACFLPNMATAVNLV